MLYKHRGLIALITVATAGGIVARLVWDAATDRQDPPIWATLAISALIVLIATVVEAQVDRRQARRTRRGAAR
ncbi:hypothetical protein ACFVS9_28495 [Streptomyces sp. NPDC058008]|uniref:hypothetical protein n=1 Tax=Streptomyces sp. NPDC058008 TaxID=3346303 RepID=UPI0036E8E830